MWLIERIQAHLWGHKLEWEKGKGNGKGSTAASTVGAGVKHQTSGAKGFYAGREQITGTKSGAKGP